MPKTNTLPLCPGYGDGACPHRARVRGQNRRYCVECGKLSRANFKAMLSEQAAAKLAERAEFDEWIATASKEDAGGPAVSVTLTQGRGKFANHLERMGLGRRDSKGYHVAMPKAQADFLVSILRDAGIGVKVG